MAYGLRFPWSTNKQEFMTLPKRGDLIVLNFKKKESTPYVKRIIALPGETVSIAAGKLFINGKACGYEAIDETIYLETCLGSTQRLELMAESNTANDFPETKIKEDEYFVLNDSRENTEDSRSFGMAPADQITGKVSLILYSYGTTQDFISENKSVRWNRILTIP